MNEGPQASFAAALKRLHQQTHMTYNSYGAAKTTVSDLLNGNFIDAPRWDLVEVIVKACGGDLAWWKTRHRELEDDIDRTRRKPKQTTPATPQRVGPTIGRWDPAALGVHQVIAVGEARSDELTPYVTRAHDEELRRRLRDGHCMVVLTGTSCTGKTRAALEAVRAELPELPVMRPINAGELVRRANDLTGPCVLWLNEMHRFLTDEVVEMLASAPDSVRVIGTTRSSQWDSLTDEDGQHPAARELLVAAARVEVAECFSQKGLAKVGDVDVRMAFAASVAEDGKLIQALTGGPELMRIYRQADNALFTALVDAAVDGGQACGTKFVPLRFLEAAAPGYLTPAQRAGARLEDGIAQATKPVRGISALTARREAPDLGPPDHFEIHEFVMQQVAGDRRAIRATTWQALIDHMPNRAPRIAIAESAVRRGYLRIALCALIPIADDDEVLRKASDLLRGGQNTPHPDLETWLRCGAVRGDEVAQWNLASRATECGDRDEASRWWRQLLEKSQGRTMQDQIHALERLELLDEALTWLRPQLLAGDRNAVDAVVLVLSRTGRVDEAIELMLPLASAGDESAIHSLIWLYDEIGDDDEQRQWQAKIEPSVVKRTPRKVTPLPRPDEALLRAKLDDGEPGARARLSALLLRSGRAEEALTLWAARAEEGQQVAVLNYVNILVELGRASEAIDWLEARSDDVRWMVKLADVHRMAGDDEAAEVWDRRAAAAGDGETARRLAKVHCQVGEVLEAVDLLRPIADRGYSRAEIDLIALLPEVGAVDEAESRLRCRLERGADSYSTPALAEFLRNRGRSDEADDLERYGIEPGGTTARPWRAEPPDVRL